MPQPVYNIASPTAGGWTMHGYRVGLNYETGLGQYPRPDGLYAALRRMPGGYLNVTVYGVPAFYDSRYPPDATGRVHINFKAKKGDMMRWLLDPARRGYTLTPGSAPQLHMTGGDSMAVLFAYDFSNYSFREVAAVTFWAAPS